MDGSTIFTHVTYNLSDLIETFMYKLENAEIFTFTDRNLKTLDPRTISDNTYGRCFEIRLVNSHKKHIQYVDIRVKRSVYVHLTAPFRFLDLFTRSKLPVNIDEDQFLEINYEIHKNNHGTTCRQYSNTYANSYDGCKSSSQEKSIEEKFNCTVPFFGKSIKNTKLCRGDTAKTATQYYLKIFKATSDCCPDPCLNMISWFGLPFITSRSDYNGIGRVRLYFRKNIRMTEDFVTYGLLRFDQPFI